MSRCENCQRELTGDETGLYRRLIWRGASTFLCIDCLSEKLGVSTELLRNKIEQFRRQGCTLFAQSRDPDAEEQ